MKKKILIIIISLLIIVLLVILGVFLYKKNNNRLTNTNNNVINNEINYDCVKKGSLCTDNDILSGLSFTYAVNENDSVQFYVIDNTKDTLTLLSKESIVQKSDWYSQYSNAFGPVDALTALYDITTKWSNVTSIDNYTYNDTGFDYYDKKCISKTNFDKDYMCAQSEDVFYGYKNYLIKDGNGIINNADGSSYELQYDNVNARLITKEEIERIIEKAGNKKIDWLVGSNPFWTMTSATEKESDYFLRAYAVWKDKQDIKMYPYYIMDDPSPVGIRPVIIIDKS